MKRPLDRLDRRILAILQRDGRTPNTEIARQEGVSPGTVRRRIAALIEDGLIKIVAVVDPEKVGMSTVAFIHLDVDLAHLDEAAKALCRMPFVLYVAYTTGQSDVLIQAVFPNHKALADFWRNDLARVPGVLRSDTSIQLEVSKQSFEWSIPGAEETR